MALLADLQLELNAAINSLGGKQQHHVEDKYYFFAVAHINRALHGFLFLRSEGLVDAAKHLIRPALEAMIRVQAVRNQPHLVYRIMYTETLEDDKWYGRAAKRQGLTSDHSRNSSAWIEFTESCKVQFGADKMIDQELSLFAAAEIAGINASYDTHYRMYCRYTHGGMLAATGSIDELADPEDSRTMVLCAFCALDAIASIGAKSPNLESLNERVIELGTREPEPLVRQVEQSQH